MTPKERDHLLGKARTEVAKVHYRLSIIKAIAVDAQKSDDPEVWRAAVKSIKEAIEADL